MAPLKQGSRGVTGMRGVWGGLKYDRGIVVVPPHGILILSVSIQQPTIITPGT